MSYTQHRSEESIEDYLETILILSTRLPQVRSIDIANHLNYSKPSISIAMKNLKNKGYISVSKEGYIRLTEEGQQIAASIYERHTVLSNWLIELGVDSETAVHDACKIEHDISPESFEAMKKFIQNTSA